MPQIRPISDLRNNFAEISRIAHANAEPIFLTKNGYGDMVVMSVELYEKLGIAGLVAEQEPLRAAAPQEEAAPEEAARTEKADNKKAGAMTDDLKIQKPLSLWQKTLSDLVSR